MEILEWLSNVHLEMRLTVETASLYLEVTPQAISLMHGSSFRVNRSMMEALENLQRSSYLWRKAVARCAATIEQRGGSCGSPEETF